MTAQTILPANSATGAFEVTNSLRFNGSNSSLSRTVANAAVTNAVFSCWFKRSTLSANQTIYSTQAGNEEVRIKIHSDNKLDVYHHDGSNYVYRMQTNRLFVDPSAWYHLLIRVDTTNGTADNRIRIYINGTQETSFAARSNPASDSNIEWFQGATGYIGISEDGSSNPFGGYLAEVAMVDGSTTEHTVFGEFDEDTTTVWKPKVVYGAVSLGTNGWYLNFKDSSSLGNSTGNSNNFTANNLAVTDQSIDTCQNNFATFNAAHPTLANAVLSKGNLQFASDGSASTQNPASSSIAVSTGKWYAEFNVVAESTDGGSFSYVGVAGTATWVSAANNAYYIGNAADTIAFNGNRAVYSASNEVDSSETNYANGNIVGVAADFTNSKIYFHVNGTYINSGDPAGASNGYDIPATAQSFYYFAVSIFGKNASWQANFGSPPYAISSGNADADGHGNFEYAVPSGYFALCSKNLAEYG